MINEKAQSELVGTVLVGLHESGGLCKEGSAECGSSIMRASAIVNVRVGTLGPVITRLIKQACLQTVLKSRDDVAGVMRLIDPNGEFRHPFLISSRL